MHTSQDGAETWLPTALSANPTRIYAANDTANDTDTQWRAHMADRQSNFASEPRDAKWAEKTLRALKKVLDQDRVLGPMARDAECRSRTCRLEIVNIVQSEFDQALSGFLGRIGHLLPNAELDFSDNADGSNTASLYLTSGNESGG